MLLRILKNNTTFGYLLIPLLTLLAWLPELSSDTWQPMVFDAHPMPLFELITNYIALDSPVSKILAMVLLMIIGFYLINLNSRHIILSERTLLPTFFFIMIASSLTPLHRLHPALIAVVFFLPALDRLLSSYKMERLSYNYFEASFLIGAGSLIYFNLMYYIILVWVALLILRPVIWREWMFSLLGIILAWMIFASGYYLIHDSFAPVADLFIKSFTARDPYNFLSLPEIIFFSFLLLLIFFGSLRISGALPKMKVLPRKTFVLFFWIWALTLIMYFLIETANIELLVVAAVPVSFLLSHYVLSLRSGFWSNLVLWGIIAGVQILVWLPRII
jgi:hypothetical protein